MKKLYLSVVLTAFALVAARADSIALWTFESSFASITGTNAALSGILADAGVGMASGSHATAAVWSSPAGNGSAHSFSVNTWAQNDFFQFQVSTLGFKDIIVSYDQTRSSTGPGTFTFAYGTDGVNFAPFSMDYTVLNNTTFVGPPATVPWSSTTARQSVYTLTCDLSALSALNNSPTVFFRVIDDTATGATGGTCRIDNFEVTGTAVPEPSLFALLCLGAGLLGLRRLRR